MRQSGRRVEWGLVLAVVLGLLSVWPLIVRGGLPHGTALELYVQRVAEMADALQDGIIYPRWAPTTLYGYGSPLFNYVAPGSLYPAALFELVTESSPVDGVRFMLVAAALAGAAGMYGFVRRRWGAIGGLIAVGCFSLSPALLFILPYIEGEYAPMIALQLTPVVLWAIDRLLDYGRGWDFVGLALATALLLLADELLSPYLFLLVGGWLIWLGIFDRRPRLTRALLAVVLGSVISAVFWLPALAEQSLVTWVTLPDGSPAGPLSLGELLAPTRAMDFGAFNPAAVRNLGLPAWLLGIAAAFGQLVYMWKNARHARQALKLSEWWLYFGLVTVGLIGMVARGESAGLPPHLLLGLLVLPVSVMAARAAVWLSFAWNSQLKLFAVALLIGLPVLGAFPLLHPPDWPANFGGTDSTARFHLELDGYGLATVAPGRRVPLPLGTNPTPSRAVIESVMAGRIDRINRTALPAGRVDMIESGAGGARLLVRSSEALTLDLYLTAFPGWHVQRGTGELSWVSNPDGQLRVEIPAGAYELAVVFQGTLIQGLGVALGLLGLAGAGLIGFFQKWSPSPFVLGERACLTSREARAVTLALGLLLAGLPVALSSPGLFWEQSPRGVVLDDSLPLRSYTQTGLDVLAYRLGEGKTVFVPGQTLDLTVYWRAVRSIPENLQVAVSLTSVETGQRAGQSYKSLLGGYPTSRWTATRYVRDTHRIAIGPEVPAGSYLLQVETWTCGAASLAPCLPEQRIEFFDVQGGSLGTALTLPILITVRPASLPS